MLGQWLDRNERLKFLSALPVLRKLVGVQSSSLPHEAERALRERAIQHPERSELNLRDVLAVLRVEVRGRVIRTVHPDDDPRRKQTSEAIQRLCVARRRKEHGNPARDDLPGPLGRRWALKRSVAACAARCAASPAGFRGARSRGRYGFPWSPRAHQRPAARWTFAPPFSVASATLPVRASPLSRHSLSRSVVCAVRAFHRPFESFPIRCLHPSVCLRFSVSCLSSLPSHPSCWFGCCPRAPAVGGARSTSRPGHPPRWDGAPRRIPNPPSNPQSNPRCNPRRSSPTVPGEARTRA